MTSVKNKRNYDNKIVDAKNFSTIIKLLKRKIFLHRRRKKVKFGEKMLANYFVGFIRVCRLKNKTSGNWAYNECARTNQTEEKQTKAFIIISITAIIIIITSLLLKSHSASLARIRQWIELLHDLSLDRKSCTKPRSVS